MAWRASWRRRDGGQARHQKASKRAAGVAAARQNIGADAKARGAWRKSGGIALVSVRIEVSAISPLSINALSAAGAALALSRGSARVFFNASGIISNVAETP